MSRFTAQQVCSIVSNDDPNDPEFLFDGNDDDLGMSLLDCADKDDYDPTMVDNTMFASKDNPSTSETPYSSPHALSH